MVQRQMPAFVQGDIIMLIVGLGWNLKILLTLSLAAPSFLHAGIFCGVRQIPDSIYHSGPTKLVNVVLGVDMIEDDTPLQYFLIEFLNSLLYARNSFLLSALLSFSGGYKRLQLRDRGMLGCVLVF